MRLPRITRKRLIIGIIILIVTIPLLAFGLLYLVTYLAFSSSDFGLIGPDCNGLPIHITGSVQNMNGQPIADAKIRVSAMGFDKDLDLEFTSDNRGYFSYSGARSLFMFACDYLIFDVSASDFKDKSVTYSLYGDYTEDQLSTTNTNLIDIAITLERAA